MALIVQYTLLIKALERLLDRLDTHNHAVQPLIQHIFTIWFSHKSLISFSICLKGSVQWFPLKKLAAHRITTLNSLINEHTRLGFWGLFSTILAKFQPNCLLNSIIFFLPARWFRSTSLVLFQPCSITRYSKKIPADSFILVWSFIYFQKMAVCSYW